MMISFSLGPYQQNHEGENDIFYRLNHFTFNSLKTRVPANFPTYLEEVNLYQSIIAADMHIVCNRYNDLKNSDISEILFAMINRKPVVLLNFPIFAKDVNLFARDVIKNRLNKLLLCDITIFDRPDLQEFIRNATSQPINYMFTRHEEVLIRSRTRAHFRKLLSIGI